MAASCSVVLEFWAVSLIGAPSNGIRRNHHLNLSAEDNAVLLCWKEWAEERDEDAGWHAESIHGVPRRMHVLPKLPTENT